MSLNSTADNHVSKKTYNSRRNNGKLLKIEVVILLPPPHDQLIDVAFRKKLLTDGVLSFSEYHAYVTRIT